MIVLDLETAGLDETDPIIQIAAVAVNPLWDILGEFEVKLEFDVTKPEYREALTLNHFDPTTWHNEAVSPCRAALQFQAFCKPYKDVPMVSKCTGKPYSVARLAGYNALTFDAPRLQKLFRDTDNFLPCHYRVLDVLQLVQWWFEISGETPPPEFKLGVVLEHFGISSCAGHDALVDARNTVKLGKILMGLFRQSPIRTLS